LKVIVSRLREIMRTPDSLWTDRDREFLKLASNPKIMELLKDNY